MKRACILLVPALFLLALAAGCEDDESQPTITRLIIKEVCGVAPHKVEGFVALSGGNETGDPVGGNNNLDVRWDWGDRGVGSTSIAYHTYYTPGVYPITVTGTDIDGNTTFAVDTVTVLPDSLVMEAGSDIPVDVNNIAHITTADTVFFEMITTSCNIDYPTVLGDSVKMEFTWQMGDLDDTVYHIPTPEFRYFSPGQYEVNVSIFYPAWAVFREQKLLFDVTDP